jgi:photosystem II oxygen-evolving enhancer protein 2
MTEFMVKRFFARVVARLLPLLATFVLALSLQGCVSIGAGLNAFVDDIDGYRFLYPNGWVQVKMLNSGLDVVFHDIIEQTENLSVVINPTPGTKSLKDLGSPSEVGYQLSKSAIAPDGSGRTAELVDAAERETNGKIYYQLEYLVKLADGRERHNVASASVSRGKLFTFNASTPSERWEAMKAPLEQAAQSFTVN